MVFLDTPVEKHNGIYVKREDLCHPDIPISKIRGAFPHIAARKERTIVCLDTWRSLNGLITAAVCKDLGKQCIVAFPEYKKARELPEQQRLARDKYGAELLPIPAGRQRIMKYQVLKALGPPQPKALGPPQPFEDAPYYIMPEAFRLPETAQATRVQYLLTRTLIGCPDHLVVPIGTGTHLTGLLEAINAEKVWAVLGYSMKTPPAHPNLTVIDQGFDYRDSVETAMPFAGSPYYESKAWQWLQFARLRGTVLFWNIGAPLNSVK